MIMEKIVYIEDMAALGDGVARERGKICFVPYACPGDELRIRITQCKPKFERGEIVEILKPGPGRRSPPCPLFKSCGGCAWLHLTEQTQHAVKQKTLARALNSEAIAVSWIPSKESLGYRRLARLHYEPASRILGFMEPGNRRVVPIPHCPVLADELCDALPHLQEMVQLLESPVEVRLALGQDGPVAAFHSDSSLSSDFYRRVEDLREKVFAGILVEVEGMVTTLYGISHVESLGFDGAPMVEPAVSFGQANHGINQELVKTVSSWTAERKYRHVLELFSGSGNLTIALAPQANQTTTVELDGEACRAARRNVEKRGIRKVTIICGDALETFQSLKQSYDLVVLDPPRTGHLELAKAISASATRAVLYVSCNPATLSRDVAELKSGGFHLVKAKGFDMFPQTPHIEAATLLER